MVDTATSEQAQSSFAPALFDIGDVANRIREVVSNAIGELYNRLRDFVGDIISGIVGVLGDVLGRITEVMSSVVTAVINGLATFFEQLPDIILRVGDIVANLIRTAFTRLGDILEGILQTLKPLIDRLAHFIEDVLPRIIANIAEYIGRLAESVITVAKNIAGAIKDGISGLVERLKPYFEPLVHAIQSIVSKLHDVFMAIIAFVTAKIRPVWDYLDSTYIRPFATAIKNFISDVGGLGSSLGNALLEPFSLDPDMPQALRGWANTTGIGRVIFGFGLAMLAVPFLFPSVFSNVYFGELEKVRQNSMARKRAGVIGLDAAIDAYYKGGLSLGDVYYIASRQGIPEGHTAGLVQAYHRYPSAGDMVFLTRLGLIDYGTYATKMREQGFRDDDISIIFNATQYVPTVPDLIRMAVREVFTPEIAERFGQNEDFPAAFKEYGEKIGLSESWARSYWAAHWDLPSAQQGFEMFHRGVITRDELELLLRALDIMPFWREKLVQIAYEPYTRVDVRRMYSAGVLSREQVKRAYLDLGYDETKAENLTRWTELEYKAEARESKAKTRDLTTSTLITAYKRGVMSRANVYKYLTDLGYDEYEAEVIIDNADMEEYLRLRDKAIDRVKAAYKTGILDTVGVHEQLSKLGLKTEAIEDIVYELELDARKAVRIPDKTDILRMFKKRILTRDETIEALEGLGYGREWAERIIAVA